MAQAERSISHSDTRLSAISGIEGDLYDCKNIAVIAATLVENAFCNRKVHLQLTGRENAYHIDEDELEAMHFAVYETQKRITDLLDQYLTALGLEH